MTSDIRARLAEGAVAVADQSPQIQHWYHAEDGLRLDALDADGAALAAAASAAEEALHVQREALDVLIEGWGGGTGSGAVDFVARQCATAAGIVATLTDKSAVLTSLCEKLGHCVDAKVDAVLGGDVRGDWLTAMRAGTESVAAAYDDAAARLGEYPPARFEIPMSPAAIPAPPVTPAAPAPSIPSPPEASLQSTPSWAPGLPPIGLPDLGGPLAGLVTRIAQVLGAYSDMPAEPDTEPPDVTTPDTPVTEVRTAAPEQQSRQEAPLAAEAPAQPNSAQSSSAQPGSILPADVEPEAENKPLLPPPPPPLPPLPPLPADPVPADGTATPCEIAADELPQVGQ